MIFGLCFLSFVVGAIVGALVILRSENLKVSRRMAAIMEKSHDDIIRDMVRWELEAKAAGEGPKNELG